MLLADNAHLYDRYVADALSTCNAHIIFTKCMSMQRLGTLSHKRMNKVYPERKRVRHFQVVYAVKINALQGEQCSYRLTPAFITAQVLPFIPPDRR